MTTRLEVNITDEHAKALREQADHDTEGSVTALLNEILAVHFYARDRMKEDPRRVFQLAGPDDVITLVRM